jgi:hypothetical protein
VGDGLLAEKLDQDGKGAEVTPADIRAMKAYVDANRTLTSPFDIVVGGKTAGLERAQLQEQLLAWREAGVTWWVEGIIDESEEGAAERIRRGPPVLG